MSLTQWVKTLAINDNSNIMPNLVSKSETEVLTTPNSFNHSWGNTNKLRINSDGTNEVGVQFNFDGLEIGDLIEIEAEVRVISGSNPLLKIAEYNINTLAEPYPLKKTFELNDQWGMIKLKTYVVMPNNTGNHRAFIGLEVGQSGIFELRSVRAIAHTKAIQPQDKIDRGYYRYILKKISGIWTMQNGSSVGSVNQASNWSLELNFPTQGYPSVFISSSLGTQYKFGFVPPSATKVTLSCKKDGDETGTGSDWTVIPDNTMLYILVVYKY